MRQTPYQSQTFASHGSSNDGLFLVISGRGCHILLGCQMHSKYVNMSVRNAGDIGGAANNTWCLEEHAEKSHRCWNGSWCSQRDFSFHSLYCVMEAVFFTFTLTFSFAVYSFQANIRGTKTHFRLNSFYIEEFWRHEWVLRLTFCAGILLGGLGTFLNVKFTFTALIKNVIRETWNYHEVCCLKYISIFELCRLQARFLRYLIESCTC